MPSLRKEDRRGVTAWVDRAGRNLVVNSYRSTQGRPWKPIGGSQVFRRM